MAEEIDSTGLDSYMASAARAAEVIDEPSVYSAVTASFDRDVRLAYTRELISKLRQSSALRSNPERAREFFTTVMGFDPLESTGDNGEA